MRPIEKYVEAMENKDFAGLAELFTPDGILLTIVPPPLPSRNIISTEKRPSICSSVTNSASAATPFWMLRS